MKRVLLIVGGGIAAYKACELIRLLKKRGHAVRCVMTDGASHFVTPMTLAALSEDQVYTSLWDLKDEAEMGHIQLSRQADLIVVAPATADLIARMAAGIADDLATTLLLATDKPVLAAPAMNVRMWQHPATSRNVAQLRRDGVTLLEPDEGTMACGEYGPGRLPEPDAIAAAIDRALAPPDTRLSGRHILVTAGPTHEAIDPVRYIANRSSGKQGFAIAGALAALGAEVTLVAGPVQLATPKGVRRVDVVSAQDMADAVQAALPADAAVMVAAVADWRVEAAPQKVKKGNAPPAIVLTENVDILATVAQGPNRPRLVVGFAAETEQVIEHARAKRDRKGADWIVANDVSGDVFGGDANTVHLVTADGVESWERMGKDDVATRIAARIADAFATS
ncbi:bifunctional phosphopantothenoylcysteine decarboxylase/phosphopantothenate--cysteine ligase CoaBC [Sphingomonas sp. S6]|jgi:phosphopantothenoylcysteine decarboxylase/phosphopantothenate--cysteine ligase|uniref:bifunctional phosphopantothenoylcysteine decarboxylase/phosphopantothenate--cysteine ligase CoaBC n=1 Tax=Sphingomonas sp. S6 TaxID=3368600 RepID=UPI000FA6B858|nr:bifunctional phosphopantothenoylcysteine decarboxylase/phosphopantothenate--cysteine ligase CoaBC [uncultured Sphingomonas sp.]RTL23543.1 MAG: bifunctional phosphopantothenoylcysteine decarboxylase/phosphopantothenate--cysteine ligase CoaBC [Sphingomonadaceae bacterium]